MPKINWLNLWFEDKESILDTMRRNLTADIEAGYSLTGNSVRKQKAEIELYSIRFDEEAKRLREMEPSKALHWCYIDLKRRGAIA